MTDDIVTRLRNKYQGQLPIMLEAANEIERLRKERDQFRKFWIYAIDERDRLLDTAFPTNENYTSFIHPDAKGDL
jgi:hypothetical protein